MGEKDIPDETNPRFAIEEFIYSGAEHELYAKDVNSRILQPLKEAGLVWDDFGEYVLYQRIIQERADIANPWGITAKRAKENLALMREQFGADGIVALATAQDELFKIRGERVFDLMDDSQIFTEELTALIKDNEFYVTFNVTKYMEQNFGSGIGAQIYEQIGTLEAIENPATATILKDASLIASMHRNIAKRDIAETLAPVFVDEIQEAPIIRVGNFNKPKPPTDPRQGLITFMDKGKIRGFYVPAIMATAWNHEFPIMMRTIGNTMKWFLGAPMFRTLFVEINYGFWMFNLRRDFVKLYRGLPGASLNESRIAWMRGIKPAFQSIFTDVGPIGRSMLAAGALIPESDPRGFDGQERAIERQLARFGIDVSTGARRALGPVRRALDRIYWPMRQWTRVGRAFERVPKFAGWIYLAEKRPEMSIRERAHIVRWQAGSPPFLLKSLFSPITNNLFLFSDAMKVGWRAELELFDRSPSSWVFKMTVTSFLPKLIRWLIRAGIIGTGTWVVKTIGGGPEEEEVEREVTLQELFENISEYDLMNFDTYPIGITKAGKTVYIRVPVDEEARAFGGMMWNILNANRKDIVRNVVDYASGQAPNLVPSVSIGLMWQQYMSGRNPYDAFRGRNILSDTEFEARDRRAVVKLLKRSANMAGSGIIYRFDTNDPTEIKTKLEEVLDLPILDNLLGRWIKISDFGIRQKIREAKQKPRTENARRLLDAKDLIKRFTEAGAFSFGIAAAKIQNGELEALSEKDILALAEKYDFIDDSLKKNMVGQFGGVWLQELENARSKKEKVAVLKLMIERRRTARERVPPR